MNYVSVILLILFSASELKAQDSLDITTDKIHSFVKQKAAPKEGLQVFMKNFVNEFNMAASTIPTEEVKFTLRFVIEKDGTFSAITAETQDTGYSQEAIRVLQTMPAWNPAKNNDEVVRSKFIIPITLKVPQEIKQVLQNKKAAPKEGFAIFMSNFIKEFKVDKKVLRKTNALTFKLLFVIEKDGSLTNVRVAEDEFNAGQEAVRVMKLMPAWNPAIHNGVVVRSNFTMPITLKIN